MGLAIFTISPVGAGATVHQGEWATDASRIASFEHRGHADVFAQAMIEASRGAEPYYVVRLSWIEGPHKGELALQFICATASEANHAAGVAQDALYDHTGFRLYYVVDVAWPACGEALRGVIDDTLADLPRR